MKKAGFVFLVFVFCGFVAVYFLQLNPNVKILPSTYDVPSDHLSGQKINGSLSSNRFSKFYANATTIQTFNGFRKKEKKNNKIEDVTEEELNEFHNINKNDNNDQITEKLAIPTNITTKERIINKVINTDVTLKYTGEFKRRYPQAIIVGVKKGGTRALLSFLSKHPMIQSAGREMHFFDKNDQYALGLKHYLGLMPMSYENEITMEKTPSYFVKKKVPARIYSMSPSTKLIFIFRDPVQRVISDYAQSKAKKTRIASLEKNIFLKDIIPETIDKDNNKILVGLYAKHLRRWLKYFPISQMCFINGDAFIKDPVPSIIEVQKFLNLPILIDRKSFYYNSSKGFYCIIRRNKQKTIFSDCLGASKGRKHPDIKQDTLNRMTDFYRKYNQEFFKLINRNFGWAV